MSYVRPSLEQIIQRIQADLRNRVTGSTTFLRRSVFVVLSYVMGASVYLLYEFINYVKSQLFIYSADIEHLDRHGAEYNLLRDSGELATGTVTITGGSGKTIPANTELQDDDGVLYRTNSAVVISSGTVDVNITAAEVGIDGNQEAGTILSFVSLISGVDATVTVDSSGITGGEDEETDESYRIRLLRRKAQPPHGGATEDYITWALEYPGVTRAWASPMWQGPGTIAVTFVQDNNEGSIFPNSSVREALRNYIISHTDVNLGITVGIPVTAEPGFFVPANSALSVNFTIGIYPNTVDIQSSVTSKLEDLILVAGGAEKTITIGEMYEAIMSATDIERAKISIPEDDVTATALQVHQLGTITFVNYGEI